MKLIIFFLILFSQIIFAQKETEISKLLSSGKYQEIIKILTDKKTQGIELNFDEYYAFGISYQNLMNFNNAIVYFMLAKEIQQDNVELLSHLANAFSSSGNHSKAKGTYNKILKLEQNNIKAKINLASELYILEEFDESIEKYYQLLEYDSTNAYFYFQLGLCNIKIADTKKAKNYLSKSIKINPNNLKAVMLLVRLYNNEEEYEHALKVVQNALLNNAENIVLNNLLADTFYKMKKYNEAIIKYLYVTTLGDTSYTVFQKLGMSYYYISFSSMYLKSMTRNLKIQEGIGALLTAYEIENQDPITTLYLGLCYKELNDFDNSIKFLEETLNNVFPDYIDQIYSNLGFAYSSKDKLRESIDCYKEAIEFNPKRKILLYYLANVYDRYYKDKSVPLKYYKKFIKEAEDADTNLINYSKYRIKELTQEKDFWKGKKK